MGMGIKITWKGREGMATGGEGNGRHGMEPDGRGGERRGEEGMGGKEGSQSHPL